VVDLPTPYDPFAACIGDVSCDGTISALDGSYILQYDAGLIADFPCETSAITPPAGETRLMLEDRRVFLELDSFALPLHIETANENILAYNLVLQFDPDIVALEGVATAGTRSAGWQVAVNASVPGELRVALAGIGPLGDEGPLLLLKGNTVAHGDAFVQVVDAEINEGDPLAPLPMALVTVRNCAYPVDFLEALPAWPSGSIGDLIRMVDLCSRQ